ncbi:MAG: hypothetical protein ACREBU_21765, partial [Nitrososphaera sp.]
CHCADFLKLLTHLWLPATSVYYQERPLQPRVVMVFRAKLSLSYGADDRRFLELASTIEARHPSTEAQYLNAGYFRLIHAMLTVLA